MKFVPAVLSVILFRMRAQAAEPGAEQVNRYCRYNADTTFPSHTTHFVVLVLLLVLVREPFLRRLPHHGAVLNFGLYTIIGACRNDRSTHSRAASRSIHRRRSTLRLYKEGGPYTAHAGLAKRTGRNEGGSEWYSRTAVLLDLRCDDFLVVVTY